MSTWSSDSANNLTAILAPLIGATIQTAAVVDGDTPEGNTHVRVGFTDGRSLDVEVDWIYELTIKENP